jgi:RNA polymerase sporulation-specific sigma factor
MKLEDIIKINEKLIYKVSGCFYNVSKEDLFQAGVIGIIKAYKNYSKDGTCKFSTYAYPYIYGEMYNLVNEENQIKISKDYLNLYKKIEMTRYSMAQRLGRVPGNLEVANFLEMDIKKLEQVIISCSVIMSLDKEVLDGKNIYEIIPEDESISLSERLEIMDSLKTLSDVERRIINYRYFNDLTQSEVARKLKMTQVMVSRYEQKSLNKLRTYYKN